MPFRGPARLSAAIGNQNFQISDPAFLRGFPKILPSFAVADESKEDITFDKDAFPRGEF